VTKSTQIKVKKAYVFRQYAYKVGYHKSFVYPVIADLLNVEEDRLYKYFSEKEPNNIVVKNLQLYKNFIDSAHKKHTQKAKKEIKLNTPHKQQTLF